MESLTIKYRPRCLDEVLGQPAVVRALKQFVREPYPAAFLLHGESGTGKTATAYALAGELGVEVAEGPLGGFFEIASGRLTGDAVKEHMDHLHYRPLFGSGWRALVANEADAMTEGADKQWLDALEHLPPTTVVVFTTNNPDKLSKRFRDRCEAFAFEGAVKALRPAIRALAKRIWDKEVGRGAPPRLELLGTATLIDETASFRLALQQLAKLIREVRHGSGKKLNGVVKQMAHDHLETGHQYEATCERCGHEQDVDYGCKRHRCEKCKKHFKLEWQAMC